jgi:hypothetical protein
LKNGAERGKRGGISGDRKERWKGVIEFLNILPFVKVEHSEQIEHASLGFR